MLLDGRVPESGDGGAVCSVDSGGRLAATGACTPCPELPGALQVHLQDRSSLLACPCCLELPVLSFDRAKYHGFCCLLALQPMFAGRNSTCMSRPNHLVGQVDAGCYWLSWWCKALVSRAQLPSIIITSSRSGSIHERPVSNSNLK